MKRTLLTVALLTCALASQAQKIFQTRGRLVMMRDFEEDKYVQIDADSRHEMQITVLIDSVRITSGGSTKSYYARGIQVNKDTRVVSYDLLRRAGNDGDAELLDLRISSPQSWVRIYRDGSKNTGQVCYQYPIVKTSFTPPVVRQTSQSSW